MSEKQSTTVFILADDSRLTEADFRARHPITTAGDQSYCSSHGTAYAQTSHFVPDDEGDARPLASHGCEDLYRRVATEERSWRV